MSGFGTNESNPLFRQSHSMASMSPYSEKTDPTNISQLALPAARPLAREVSPASSESGGTRETPGIASDPNRLPPAPYPYGYPTNDDADGPILSGFPAQQVQQVYPVQQEERHQRAPSGNRGVSLVDSGPVPAAPHDPVRRVSRHQRRSSSRNQLVSPVTASSHSSHLPPGAVSR